MKKNHHHQQLMQLAQFGRCKNVIKGESRSQKENTCREKGIEALNRRVEKAQHKEEGKGMKDAQKVSVQKFSEQGGLGQVRREESEHEDSFLKTENKQEILAI